MNEPKTLVSLMERRVAGCARRFVRFTHRTMGVIRGISSALAVLAFVASVCFVACFIIHTGYDHTPREIRNIGMVVRMVQGVFVARVLFDLVFRFRHTVRSSRFLKWVADIAVLVSVLPWIYPRPQMPWIPFLDDFLYSKAFLLGTLGVYSALTFCYGLMKAVGRRTNPSLLLSCSFLVLIFVGSLLLMLPKCTYGGISYIDALFVSTSAVCITGLTPIDISVHLTPMGIAVLSILIQVGGLGVMTFTSFFALFFSGGTSIYNQLLLRDMIYSKSMNALVPTLLYILGFTVVVELVGALAVYISIAGTLGPTADDEIVFALFHSLSAFCNAGFSTLPQGLGNPLLLHGNISIYWITTFLVISGSIGFPILVNFKDAIAGALTRVWRRLRNRPVEARNIHPYSMNTKIVLVTFFALFVIGAAGFWALEDGNSLRGMTFAEKAAQSAFNSATPRSAGFSSVNPSGFLNVTIVMVLFLMWVGGASQSTGGGIKVNTFAAILLNLRAIVTGRSRVTAFKRTVNVFSIRRANAVVALSILSYTAYSITLLILEPAISPRSLLFETASALFTVGSSLGATPLLGAASKAVLCSAMFLGRVGIISLLAGLAGRRHEVPVGYPDGNIIIT